MHLLLGEVPVALPALGLALSVILDWLVALAILALLSYIVNGIVVILDNVVGRIWGLSSLAKWAAGAINDAIARPLERAVRDVEHGMVDFWHAATAEVTWFVGAVEQEASLIHSLVSIVVGDPTPQARRWINSAIHLLLKPTRALLDATIHNLEHVATLVEHPLRGPIGTAIHDVTRPIKHDLSHFEDWTRPRVKAVEHTIAGTIEPDIRSLRDAARSIENEALRVYKDAAGVWHVANKDAVAVAVAVGLTALGLEGLRCNSLGNLLGNRGCGTWRGLEDLLALATAFGLAFDFRDLVKAAESVAGEAEAILKKAA